MLARVLVLSVTVALTAANSEESTAVPSICSPPQDYPYRNIEPIQEEYRVGDEVTFSCSPELQLRGAERSRCDEGGIWSNEEPECVPFCQWPGRPVFGSVSPDKLQYEAGEEVSFSCPNGFMLKGSNSSVCDAAGVWSQAPPKCMQFGCSLPHRPMKAALLVPEKERYFLGEEVSFLCRQSSEVIDGNDTAVCQPNGSWSGHVPSCKSVGEEKKKTSCSWPGKPDFGFVIPNELPYRFGERITFTCQKGYELKGSNFSVCQEDGEWSHPLPVCESASFSCSFPLRTVESSLVEPQRQWYSPGEVITFRCRDPAKKPNGPDHSRCLSDGTWSHLVPGCVIEVPKCRWPGVPNFGTVNPDKLEYDVGETINFTCKQFYRLIGRPSITCGKEGRWSHFVPYCAEPFSCKFPRSKSYSDRAAHIEPEKQWYSAGESVNFTCRDPFEKPNGAVNSTCRPNGQWSNTVPRCVANLESIPESDRADYTCKWPGKPNFGELFPDKEKYQIGENVTVKCNKGFFPVRKEGTSLVCEQKDVWSNKPTPCESVVIRGCNYPLRRAGAALVLPEKDRYDIGETVNFTCRDPHEQLPEAKRNATCLIGHVWTSAPPICSSHANRTKANAETTSTWWLICLWGPQICHSVHHLNSPKRNKTSITKQPTSTASDSTPPSTTESSHQSAHTSPTTASEWQPTFKLQFSTPEVVSPTTSDAPETETETLSTQINDVNNQSLNDDLTDIPEDIIQSTFQLQTNPPNKPPNEFPTNSEEEIPTSTVAETNLPEENSPSTLVDNETSTPADISTTAADIEPLIPKLQRRK